MRRGLSISLILFFWLGPLAATLPSLAGDESRLPACCRRHGAHHCTMSAQMMGQTAAQIRAALEASGPILTAPSHCPFFPQHIATLTAPLHALAAVSVGLPVQLARPHSPAASRAAARVSQRRTRDDRGPPALPLA